MLNFQLPWHEIFAPTHSLMEMLVRGTIMYFGIFILMRLILKRQTGGISIPDVLLVVLLADAAQNGMAGEYRSITEGLVLVATIVFWNFAIDWLGYRVPFVERLVRPPPLLLIKNGQVLRRHLRQELVTMDELLSKLREEGVESPADVIEAYIEGDGNISVKKKEK
ncbi:DUF421 domain-containing protein [Bradyrhizobium sp. LVM 105]|nr:DUF421 domain-containing protein [Bradyrhizobium sp. LVM 105]